MKKSFMTRALATGLSLAMAFSLAATKTQADIYNNIDFSSEFTIADYPDVFIDGQTFFTISGK